MPGFLGKLRKGKLMKYSIIIFQANHSFLINISKLQQKMDNIMVFDARSGFEALLEDRVY